MQNLYVFRMFVSIYLTVSPKLQRILQHLAYCPNLSQQMDETWQSIYCARFVIF